MVSRILVKTNYLKELGFRYPRNFISKFEKVVNDVIPAPDILGIRNLPSLIRPHDLANFLNISLSRLHDLTSIREKINPSESFYKRFKIPKKAGGYRTILAPNKELKKIQKKIYERILKKVPPSVYATGFRPKYSIVHNANMHLKSIIIYNVDLKDFFPSIDFHKVVKVFREIGYSGTISFLLALLCCYIPRKYLHSKLVFTKNTVPFLPQGACTSPAISNLVCVDLDKDLSKIGRIFGFNYSRYADDMTFSSIKYKSVLMFFRYYLFECVAKHGFRVNKKKERYSRNRPFYKRVTGVIVHEDHITLPRKFVKNLRAALHQLQNSKIPDNEQEIFPTIRNIQGRIAYATMVNKEKYVHFYKKFHYLMKTKFKEIYPKIYRIDKEVCLQK